MQPSPLTIAIPYHENPHYLRQALASVAAQSQLPQALILIDNSPDASGLGLLDTMPCATRYIRAEPKLGLAHYFNLCFEQSQSAWCSILHADDRLLPDYVETMTQAMAQQPQAVALFCKTQAIDRHGRRSFSPRDWAKQFLWPRGHAVVAGEEGVAALLRGNFIMCPTLCYNLAALNGRRFDTHWRFMLDLEFYTRLLLEGEHMVGVGRTLYACRRHPAATTAIHERNFAMFEEGVRCIRTLSARARAHGWHRAARAGQHMVLYHLYVLYRVLLNVRPRTIGSSLKFLLGYWQSLKPDV